MAGETWADPARTALRLGAKKVMVFTGGQKTACAFEIEITGTGRRNRNYRACIAGALYQRKTGAVSKLSA